MQQPLVLLAKSIACAGVFFLYYQLFLKGKKLHQYNRGYLLLTTALSLVIPFLSFKSYSVMSDDPGDIVLLNAIDMGKEYELVTGEASRVVSAQTIFLYAYALISTALLLSLVARIVWVYRLRRKGEVVRKDGYQLVLTDSAQAPFSFLNNLFWKRGMDLETAQGRQVVAHELCHIRQRHTWDKLFMQLTIVVAWANPFLWLMRKELALQHEFIADDAAISDGDTDAFARMVLEARYTSVRPDIIHPFFHSSIKRRLTMLTTNKRTRFSKMRMLLALPLAATMLLLLSFKLDVTKVNRSGKSIIVTLDPGHGGYDNGAIGTHGLKEKDLNLRICKKLAELSGEYNIQANLTRENDNYISLQERVAKGRSADANLYVAIHVDRSTAGEKNGMNDVAEHKATGFAIYFSGKNKYTRESQMLASAILPRMETLQIKGSLGKKGAMVINDAASPAILIECGNIDDAGQMEMLTNDAKLEAFCRSILSGIADYSNSRK